MSRPQVQLQLVRPSHLAGCSRSFTQGRSIALACRPIASPSLSYTLDMVQPGCIGRDLFQVQCSASEFLSVRHGVSSPLLDVQSTMEPVSCASTKLGQLIQGAVA